MPLLFTELDSAAQLTLKYSLLCGCFRVLPYTPDSSINATLVNPSVFSCWKEPRIHQSCSLRVSSRIATTIKMSGAGPRFSAGIISLPMQAVELQQFVAHDEMCLTVSLVFGMSVLVVLCCEIPVVLVWFMVWSMSFAKSTMMWGSGGSCNSGDKTGKRMLFFFSPWKAVFYVPFSSLKHLTVGWMMWIKASTFNSSLVGLLRISHRYPQMFSQQSHQFVQFKTLLKCPPFVMRISQIRSSFHRRAVSVLFQWKMILLALYLFCGFLVHTLWF